MAPQWLPEAERARLGWWLVAVGLAAVVVAFLLGFVGALVLGVFIYYATRPIYRRLSGRVRPPSLAAAAALVLVALPVIVLVAYTVVVGVGELQRGPGADLDIVGRVLPASLDVSAIAGDPQQLLRLAVDRPQYLLSVASTDTVRQALTVAGDSLGLLVAGLLNAFIALVVAFYLLRDGHALAGWVRSAVTREDDTFEAYLRAVDEDLAIVYFGNILNAFVVAVVAAIAFNVLDLLAPSGLGIPTPTLLGLLTGAASLIPVVGLKLVYVPIALYLFALAATTDPASLWFPIAFLVVAVVAIDGLTEVLLRPYISGRDLHVGLLLFAYVLGPIMFGWYGLFLGPLLLVLVVHFARIVLPELVRGGPVTPHATGADPVPDADGSAADPDAGDPASPSQAATGARSSSDEAS